MLIQRTSRFIFAFYYMPKARAKTDLAPAVEDDLAAADTGVREAIPVDAVDGFEYLFSQLLEDRFW